MLIFLYTKKVMRDKSFKNKILSIFNGEKQFSLGKKPSSFVGYNTDF